MINWNDTLRESEDRAVGKAIRDFPSANSLRETIAFVGMPHNPNGSNALETTLNPAGDPYLRPDRTLISDGILGD